MKIKKYISLLLLLSVLAAFCACTKKESAVSLGGVSVSGEIYAYYLACYKQYWLSALGQADDPAFWRAENGGMTNAERLTEISVDAIKKRVAAAYLFDNYNLRLTDGELKSIDLMIIGMNAASEGGNAIAEDEIFKTLGIGEAELKEILILDSKTGALQDHLYGEEGERKITDEQKEDYYQKNYYRFRLLYLMNGDFIRDEKGDIVYNEDGNATVKEISDERYEEKLGLAKTVLENVRAGDDIKKYIEEYSDELEKDDYKNGRYLCGVSEYGTLISASIMKLKPGEAGLLDSKNGIYVIQREELDAGAWKNPENEAGGDFKNFETLVLEYEFDEYLKPHMEKITVNEEVTGKYKMEELPYTFSWQYLF